MNDDRDNAGEKRTTTIRNNVAATGSDYIATSAAEVTVDVEDDDPDPTVALAVTPSVIVENGEAALITATQNIVSDRITIITITARAGPDTAAGSFTLSGTTLTIAVGQTVSTEVSTIRAHRDDRTADYEVSISGVASNAGGVNAPADVLLTVGEEAEAGVAVFAADPFTVGEGDSSIYLVSLNREPLGDVVIRVRANGNRDVTIDTDADLEGNQDTLTFTLENYRDAQSVIVRAASDDDAADETATITHSIVASQSSNEYDEVDIADVNVAIDDDETAGVTVSKSTLSIDEGRSDTYTVRLNTPPVSNVRIAVSSDNDAVTVSPTSFTLSRSNWSRGQTVTIRAAS